jgi:hypothetical protein
MTSRPFGRSTRFKAAVFLALELIAATLTLTAATPTIPTFFARRDYPGLNNSFIQVADTNDDGVPDLIVNGSSFQVLLGNGGGTFRQGPISHPVPGEAPYVVSFAVADLNGDGNADLALVAGGVVVSSGNGNGTFQTGVIYPVNDDIAYLVVGDFNGDGIPDIAVAGASGVWLLTGKGGGAFNAAVLAASLEGPCNIAVADFNEDGKLDLVVTLLVGETGHGFAVLLGNGNGTFQTPQTFTAVPRPIAVAVGSLTKGGPPSIAVNETLSSDVYLYFGNGKGSFSGPKQVSLPSGYNEGLLIGDVNGDGLPDLISDSGYVAYGEGGGSFTKPVSYPVDSAYETSNAVLADLANNGNTDIVTGGYDAISVLLNVGKGFIEDGIWTSVTGGAGCGAAADFNGDGKPDLAVNNANGISILLGTGEYLTPFTAGTPISLAAAGCLVSGDINGDGIPELLVPVNGTVVAYLGSAGGTFTLTSTTPTPSGGYLAVGDFNHDGKLDFATSGNLIALGNGDGTFQSPTDIVANPPSGGFSGVAVGDINNDGWADMVLTSGQDANTTVLLNNQQGGFTQVATNFGPFSGEPILTDLNQDGNLDLVLSQSGLLYLDPAVYGASVYLGNGTGSFTFTQTVGAQTQNPTLNLVVDINGDGIPDICELFSDTLEIYLGEGGATYATPFGIGTGPAPGSILVEDLHGQSAKAHIPDIVAPDTSGGVMVLFNLTK